MFSFKSLNFFTFVLAVWQLPKCSCYLAVWRMVLDLEIVAVLGEGNMTMAFLYLVTKSHFTGRTDIYCGYRKMLVFLAPKVISNNTHI